MLIWWIPLALIVAVIVAVVVTIKKKLNESKSTSVLPTHTPRLEEPSFFDAFLESLASWFPPQYHPAINGTTSASAGNPQDNPSTPANRILSPAVTAPPRAHNPQVRTHTAPQSDGAMALPPAEDSNAGPSTGPGAEYNYGRYRQYWQAWSLADRTERVFGLSRLGASVATLPVYEPPPPSYSPQQPISVPA